MYRKHSPANKNGTVDWACGLNSAYHKPKIAEIKARSISEEQILTYCYEVYNKRHGAFYGYAKRFDNVKFKGKEIPRKDIFKLI